MELLKYFYLNLIYYITLASCMALKIFLYQLLELYIFIVKHLLAFAICLRVSTSYYNALLVVSVLKTNTKLSSIRLYIFKYEKRKQLTRRDVSLE